VGEYVKKATLVGPGLRWEIDIGVEFKERLPSRAGSTISYYIDLHYYISITTLVLLFLFSEESNSELLTQCITC
jgi:hypothetical protein